MDTCVDFSLMIFVTFAFQDSCAIFCVYLYICWYFNDSDFFLLFLEEIFSYLLLVAAFTIAEKSCI